jgi:hypothetical protein
MGQIILNNVKCWVGAYDLSGKMNAVALNDTPDVLDDTHFGHGAKSRAKGLDMIVADLEGFWQQEPDEQFTLIGTPNIPMSIAPEPTVGGPCYSFPSQHTEFKWGGMVGELAKFSIKSESVGTKMVRGWILENGATARASTGTGTSIRPRVGSGVGDSEYLYGAIHAVAVGSLVGDTLAVKIQSDADDNWGAGVSDRITFTTILGNGGVTYQWATRVAGPITDQYWRAIWSISDGGGTHSFTFAVFMGIGT